MSVVITGGKGYIGAALVDRLVKLKRVSEITVIDNGSTGHRINTSDKVKYIDYTLGSFKGLTIETDLIIHLAGDVRSRELEGTPLAGTFNNVLATYELLQANKKHAPMIFASTGAVYGNAARKRDANENDDLLPFCVNAKTKVFAEEMVRWYYGLKKHLIFRIYNVVGVCNGIFSDTPSIETLSMACSVSGNPFSIKGRLFPTTDGTAVKDYIGISDVIDAFIKGIKYLEKTDAKAEIINIGTGKGVSVQDFLIKVEEISGKKVYNDVCKEDESTPYWVVPCIDKAKELLGWEPTLKLSENLRKTWELRYGRK